MIIASKYLKDDDGMCEVARKLSTYHEGCFVYDLIADKGYDQDEGYPVCAITDDGDSLNVVFHPYGKHLRREITLEYYEADYLMKILIFMDQQMKGKDA